LKRLITSIKPDGFGVIIRTVAQNKDVAELNKDLRTLVSKWEQAQENLKTTKPKERILGEMSRVSAIVRDLLNESFDSIVVDDENSFHEIKEYIQEIAPDKEKIVKLHTGKTKLFESRGIERQLKSLFGKSVSLAGGGYLIIEHTEALHVIDVNSGNKSNVESDQEATALTVNIQSVKEIARQLRLRDMGGIVVCDFIDMKSAENRKLVYETMKSEMKKDKAKSVILPLSKFGLMQITRQRVRPEMNITTGEACPHCKGTGKISASIMVADAINNNIDYIFTKQNEQKITLVLHPYLSAYFTKGFPSMRMKWFFKYKKWIKIQTDTSLGLTTFEILNSSGEKIELL
jgi:ribonuclease G